MAELVRFTLDDGSVVLFEAAESGLVAQEAAEEVSGALRSRLGPDEVTLEFGLKVSGEASWWFFAKAATEGTIKVTLKWSGDSRESSLVGEPEAELDTGEG